MQIIKSRNRSAPLLITIFFLLQSCVVNLPAVRDYSKATVLATNSFIDITDDLPRSCVRRVDIAFEGEKVSIKNGKVEFKEDYLSASNTCFEIEKSLDGIYGANNVLRQYAEALGKLASDDVITFTSDSKELGKNLKKIKIKDNTPFGSVQAAAISEFADFLFRAAADGYRQKELKQTIDTAEPFIGTLVGGLISIVEDYKLILEDEKLQLQDKQDKLIRKLKKKQVEEKVINEKLFEIKRVTDSIKNKQKAATDYIEVLNKITSAHTKLAQSSSKELQSTLLINIIQEYVEELIPLLNNLRKAFST